MMDKISKAVDSGKKKFLAAITPDILNKEHDKAWKEYKASGGELSSKEEWLKAGKPEVK
jgi:hypothetical protein